MSKVTIVGAGNVGATAAHIIASKNLADVVLVDVAEGLPQGKALDMMHMRSVEKFTVKVTGTNDYAATADSDIVVITAGIARKPGMTREDLLGVNSGIMSSVIEQAMAASPNAIYICVTNPLDVMTYLAFKKSGLPSNRLMGMGGVLDSSRLSFAVCEKLGCDPADVTAWALGVMVRAWFAGLALLRQGHSHYRAYERRGHRRGYQALHQGWRRGCFLPEDGLCLLRPGRFHCQDG